MNWVSSFWCTPTPKARPERQSVHARVGAAHPDHEDRRAEAGARQVRLRRCIRRRPRDEEKSARQGAHLLVPQPRDRWDPKKQRPELWRLYNARKAPGETIRVFPLSNWTELDVCGSTSNRESIPIVPLYFAADRPVVERDGKLIMVTDGRMPLNPGERPTQRVVRFRTLGCYPLTGAVESNAATLLDIIEEISSPPRLNGRAA